MPTSPSLDRVTALDVNAYRPGKDLSTSAELIERRRASLGPAYRLFYRDPIHLVRGEGAHVWDAEGRRYLDMYNNVASVGHANPRVAAAVDRQMRTLNTHTRYLHEGIVDYAEDLLSTFPDDLDTAMFTCTGSEANDLALRLVKEYTGNTGVIVTRNAYHGGTTEIAVCSPTMGTTPMMDTSWVRYVDLPGTTDPVEAAIRFAADVQAQIDSLNAAGLGVAALLIDTVFSSDGLITEPAGFIAPAVDAVRAAGGVFIADEVQPGFARTGTGLWGYPRHAVTADVVTMGKPMANGLPVAGTILRSTMTEALGDRLRYFNTFGGNPVSMAAAQAVLDEVRDRDLVTSSQVLGDRLLRGMRSIAASSDGVIDARGVGLYASLEFARDGQPDGARASDVVNIMRAGGVLVSTVGEFAQCLKVRPPLVLSAADVDLFLSCLEDAVGATACR